MGQDLGEGEKSTQESALPECTKGCGGDMLEQWGSQEEAHDSTQGSRKGSNTQKVALELEFEACVGDV